jgi:hypothetical protein
VRRVVPRAVAAIRAQQPGHGDASVRKRVTNQQRRPECRGDRVSVAADHGIHEPGHRARRRFRVEQGVEGAADGAFIRHVALSPEMEGERISRERRQRGIRLRPIEAGEARSAGRVGRALVQQAPDGPALGLAHRVHVGVRWVQRIQHE